MTSRAPGAVDPPRPFDRRAIPDAAVESRWTAPDGWPIRRIDWPAPESGCRGSLLFLPGRGDFYEKYLETLDCWHHCGWRVTAFDWRGQGGSGRLGLGEAGHIDDFATWVSDLVSLWAEWKAAGPGPHVIAAHSMGGHLALRALAERRIDPQAAVLVAPMLGFNVVLPGAVMHGAARIMAGLGDPKRLAWKWSDKPGQPPADRVRLLTHDAARYADELWWRAQRPEIAVGPGSWGWVERAYASIRGLAAQGVLERVDTPVLILAAEEDKLVSFKAIARAAARLPHCELIRFGPEGRHELLREEDGVRGRALAAIERFLDRFAPKRG